MKSLTEYINESFWKTLTRSGRSAFDAIKSVKAAFKAYKDEFPKEFVSDFPYDFLSRSKKGLLMNKTKVFKIFSGDSNEHSELFDILRKCEVVKQDNILWWVIDNNPDWGSDHLNDIEFDNIIKSFKRSRVIRFLDNAVQDKQWKDELDKLNKEYEEKKRRKKAEEDNKRGENVRKEKEYAKKEYDKEKKEYDNTSHGRHEGGIS